MFCLAIFGLVATFADAVLVARHNLGKSSRDKLLVTGTAKMATTVTATTTILIVADSTGDTAGARNSTGENPSGCEKNLGAKDNIAACGAATRDSSDCSVKGSFSFSGTASTSGTCICMKTSTGCEWNHDYSQWNYKRYRSFRVHTAGTDTGARDANGGNPSGCEKNLGSKSDLKTCWEATRDSDDCAVKDSFSFSGALSSSGTCLCMKTSTNCFWTEDYSAYTRYTVV